MEPVNKVWLYIYWLSRAEWDMLFDDFKCASAALEQWTRQKFSMGTK